MRKPLLILLLIFPTLVFAQRGEIFLKGTFHLSDSTTTYTYEVHCKADSKDSITGYSITNYGDTDETKTAIAGRIKYKLKMLVIKETRLISTKSHIPKSEFCYMQSALFFPNNIDVNGVFVGTREDGKTTCSDGYVKLKIINNSLQRHFEKKKTPHLKAPPNVVQTDTPKNYSGKVTELQVNSLKHEYSEPVSFIQINAGETRTFNFADTGVDIAVWDNKNIDGDVIDVFFNDHKVLSNCPLARKPQTLHLTLQNNMTNRLRIVCKDEGTEPTNTASIRMASGNTVYNIDAVTRMGKDVIVELHAAQH